jgi:hypothetical protein
MSISQMCVQHRLVQRVLDSFRILEREASIGAHQPQRGNGALLMARCQLAETLRGQRELPRKADGGCETLPGVNYVPRSQPGQFVGDRFWITSAEWGEINELMVVMTAFHDALIREYEPGLLGKPDFQLRSIEENGEAKKNSLLNDTIALNEDREFDRMILQIQHLLTRLYVLSKEGRLP